MARKAFEYNISMEHGRVDFEYNILMEHDREYTNIVSEYGVVT